MTDSLTEWDALWVNVQLATMAGDGGDEYGSIPDAAIAVKDGKIVWLGKRAALPSGTKAQREYDGQGHWLTPGLVDCHTHIVHGGNRSNEWEARLNGVPYEQIAQQGGGILSTVRATRAASFDELLEASLRRVDALMAEGVTTLEIKSGYGLDLATEEKMLRVAREISQRRSLNIRTTFLGAHALPPEFSGRPDDYIEEICSTMLPHLAQQGLVDAVDAFCERIAFSTTQTERVFQVAQHLGLPVKLHAEQLSDQGGAALTAKYKGLSADHLEHLSPAGIAAMAQAGTVAVLLPGAFYFLRDTQVPPVQALRKAGVPMAISTDCNPGTSPLTSLLLTMNMACTLFGLTPEEALAGVTTNAARALGMPATSGSLQIGKDADFALWDIDRPADLAYAMGLNPCSQVVFKGRPRNDCAHA